MKKAFFIAVLMAFISGCTTTPPVKNPQITEANLPSQCLIDGIKPIKGNSNASCAPTCLEMVFKFYGKELHKDVIADWVQEGYGTSIEELERFVKWNGFNIFSFSDWHSDKKRIKYFLSQGYPVLVAGQVRLEDENHLTVLVGYDDLKTSKVREKEFKGVFVAADPAFGDFVTIPYEFFRGFHSATSDQIRYYGAVVYPKNK